MIWLLWNEKMPKNLGTAGMPSIIYDVMNLKIVANALDQQYYIFVAVINSVYYSNDKICRIIALFLHYFPSIMI